jgi:hypothetical protein
MQNSSALQAGNTSAAPIDFKAISISWTALRRAGSNHRGAASRFRDRSLYQKCTLFTLSPASKMPADMQLLGQIIGRIKVRRLQDWDRQ